MRVSNIKDDPGFMDGHLSSAFIITVGGFPVENVLVADEEKNYVITQTDDESAQAVMGDDGKLIYCLAIYGDVKIKP